MSQEDKKVNGKQLCSILETITNEAKKTEKEKGLDFRFLDKNVSKTEKEKDDIYNAVEKLENDLEEKYGITVEFIENIDIKDATKGHKFYFQIWNENNCFMEIDALEYRKIVMDSSKSEVEFIADKLFKLMGLKVQDNVLKISETIAELISYIYYFDGLQYKAYEDIGWDLYNGELIFKYDKIYRNNEIGMRSYCMNEIGGSLSSEYSDEVKENWRNKFAQLMNSSTVARIVISAACTGLVRSIIPYNKESNINMNIYGEPACGKSTLSEFALSLFGNPQVLEGSFIDKENAMEIIRIKRPVIPYILDDRLLKFDNMSEQAKVHELLLDIFREYEGKVAERAGGAYRELSGQRTNAPIISSSVESMLELLLKKGRDLGQYRRFIELELKRNEIFDKESRIANEYHDLAYQNYGIGVEYIVSYILEGGIVFVNNLYNSVKNDITERLKAKSEKTGIRNLDSSASRFALIATAYVIIRESINSVNDEEMCENIEYVGNEGDISDKIRTLQENILLDSYKKEEYDIDKELIKQFVNKADDCYEQLVTYLIDNLVEKMKKVGVATNFKVDVYNNILKFISDKSNAKWFISTTKTDFFKNHTLTHIGMIEKTDEEIKITFKGKKYIEWLFCSGKELSDDQIKGYLNDAKKQSYKTSAIKLFGEDIVEWGDIEKECGRHDGLRFEKNIDSNKARNPVSITITLPKSEDSEDNKE